MRKPVTCATGAISSKFEVSVNFRSVFMDSNGKDRQIDGRKNSTTL